MFCTEAGTPIDPGNLRRVFRRVASAAGLGHIVPYAARHTNASQLLNAGASIEDVADLFGDDPMTLYRHCAHKIKRVATAGLRMRAVLAAGSDGDGSTG